MKKPNRSRKFQILYIEDDPKSRLIVKKILENAGCEIHEASDGKEGIEKAISITPDVILLDIMLPGMDGLEVARKLREMHQTSPIPVIAITARAMPKDREQIIEAGCNDYITKPIDIPLLLQTLSRTLATELHLTPQVTPPEKREDISVEPSRTLLLVDDTPHNLVILEKVFTSAGYQTLTATNGVEALETLKTHSVDMILSDIAMPLMDGYQLCFEVMRTPLTQQIYFLFYSSHYSNKNEIDFGLSLGADHYLVRPLHVRELVDTVREIFQHPKRQPVHLSPDEFQRQHSTLLTRKIMGITPQVEVFKEEQEIAAPTHVEPGRSYLIEEKMAEKSYSIFLDQLSRGANGLILTRTHPRFIREQYHLEKTPCIWLSTTTSSEWMSTTDLTEISLSVKHFISKTTKSVILFDGYEFLASKMGFGVMLQFFQSLNEFVSNHESTLLVPIDPETLAPKELRLLEKEFTSLS